MKVFILEDEVRILQHIIELLKNIPYIEIVGHAAEVASAATEIPRLQPDVILADIRLKDGDSFLLFEKIGTDHLQIIFLTAYDQYAMQALNLGALGYLLKPIDAVLLREKLEKCYQRLENRHFPNQEQVEVARNHYLSQGNPESKRIALKSVEYIEIVDIRDILYCRGDRGYTTFYLTNSREILVSKSLKEYEAILVAYGFLRCHQSYLISVNHIKKYYREGVLQMQNDSHIPVSQRKKEEVLSFLQSIS